jgi:hypothetical protein
MPKKIINSKLSNIVNIKIGNTGKKRRAPARRVSAPMPINTAPYFTSLVATPGINANTGKVSYKLADATLPLQDQRPEIADTPREGSVKKVFEDNKTATKQALYESLRTPSPFVDNAQRKASSEENLAKVSSKIREVFRGREGGGGEFGRCSTGVGPDGSRMIGVQTTANFPTIPLLSPFVNNREIPQAIASLITELPAPYPSPSPYPPTSDSYL